MTLQYGDPDIAPDSRNICQTLTWVTPNRVCANCGDTGRLVVKITRVSLNQCTHCMIKKGTV